MITGRISILIFENPACLRKCIPDCFSSSIVCIGSLYLIGTARNTPNKIIPKHFKEL